MLPSAISTASAPRIFLSRLDGWPVPSPTDASSLASRPTMHGSGTMRFATPSSCRTFTDYSLPVSRRTEIRTPDPQIRSLTLLIRFNGRATPIRFEIGEVPDPPSPPDLTSTRAAEPRVEEGAGSKLTDQNR